MAKQIGVRTKGGRTISYFWDDDGTIYKGRSFWSSGTKIGKASTFEDALAVIKLDAEGQTGSPVEQVNVR